MVNGDVVAQGSQFSMKDVEVVMACVDLDTVNLFGFIILFVFYVLLWVLGSEGRRLGYVASLSS